MQLCKFEIQQQIYKTIYQNLCQQNLWESESKFYHFKELGVRVEQKQSLEVRVGVELKKWLKVRVGVRVELILLRLCNPRFIPGSSLTVARIMAQKRCKNLADL